MTGTSAHSLDPRPDEHLVPIDIDLDHVRGGFLGALLGSAGSIMQGIESLRMHKTNKNYINAQTDLLRAQADALRNGSYGSGATTGAAGDAAGYGTVGTSADAAWDSLATVEVSRW